MSVDFEVWVALLLLSQRSWPLQHSSLNKNSLLTFTSNRWQWLANNSTHVIRIGKLLATLLDSFSIMSQIQCIGDWHQWCTCVNKPNHFNKPRDNVLWWSHSRPNVGPLWPITDKRCTAFSHSQHFENPKTRHQTEKRIARQGRIF